ncbi:MAG TPA: flagellar biosynthesis protein FlhB [Rhizomicrobium sp.]|nr:flagellar biosynthesis protein FlhB [Rhizomicrobium sp.]
MADDRDDAQRTEEPTQRRLEEAAKHGDVVKSQEVTTFVVLLGGALTIATMGSSSAQHFVNSFRVFLEQPDQITIDSGSMIPLLREILMLLAGILAPAFGLIMAMGLGSHILQARPRIALDRISPDFSKLSLTSGLKRMFGLEGLSNLGKGLLKLAVVGSVVWTVLWPERGNVESILTLTPSEVAAEMIHLVMRILIAALSVLAVIAVLDYMLQRYRFMARNRMSKQEIKDEYRQTEGDPAVKAKVKQIRIERSRRRMMAQVPTATVVITNPTHYAIALRYEAGVMAAPVCVAKGVDALAFKIREVALEHEVPVIENPPLARALYATVELDEAIPAEHFKAVAQVIGYVMRLTGKIRPN